MLLVKVMGDGARRASGRGRRESGLVECKAVEDFEQELVDHYALAMAAAGLSDGHIRQLANSDSRD